LRIFTACKNQIVNPKRFKAKKQKGRRPSDDQILRRQPNKFNSKSNIMNKHDVKAVVKPNFEKIPFKEYYNRLKEETRVTESPTTPLDDFLLIAAKETGKHPGSIRRWAYGTAKPNKLEKKAMAELLQCDADVLFPELA